MYVKGSQCFLCFGKRYLKDGLKICVFIWGFNVNEYFANLQLFGIVWTEAVTSLIFHASEKSVPYVLHKRQLWFCTSRSLFSALPFMWCTPPQQLIQSLNVPTAGICSAHRRLHTIQWWVLTALQLDAYSHYTSLNRHSHRKHADLGQITCAVHTSEMKHVFMAGQAVGQVVQ